jgi:hypothetical protein
MLSPDDPDARQLVIDIVRTIAAETGFTSVVRIGDIGIGAIAVHQPILHEPDVDYQLLLHVAAAAELVDPTGVPISACALVLPDRDIAYIKHGTTPMTTLTVGRNPIDDPDTHHGVESGLDALMQAIGDTQPPNRSMGRAFPNVPPGRMPNTSGRHGNRNGWSPPSSGPGRRGPHR